MLFTVHSHKGTTSNCEYRINTIQLHVVFSPKARQEMIRVRANDWKTEKIEEPRRRERNKSGWRLKTLNIHFKALLYDYLASTYSMHNAHLLQTKKKQSSPMIVNVLRLIDGITDHLLLMSMRLAVTAQC